MANPITLGYSPLTGKIYAGRSTPAKGMAEGVRIFTADKFDVTDQVIGIVAESKLGSRRLSHHAVTNPKKIASGLAMKPKKTSRHTIQEQTLMTFSLKAPTRAPRVQKAL